MMGFCPYKKGTLKDSECHFDGYCSECLHNSVCTEECHPELNDDTTEVKSSVT